MHNILIVDDEPGIRQSLKGVLEDEGYKASVAESGEACIESLRKRPFDGVLLRGWVPGKAGFGTPPKVRGIFLFPDPFKGLQTSHSHQPNRGASNVNRPSCPDTRGN